MGKRRILSLTYLYRHFDKDGKLLYVGLTCDPLKRLENHIAKIWRAEITTITIEKYSNRVKAAIAERLAIQRERPRYNVEYNERDVFHKTIRCSNESIIVSRK